jgi:hypothetical protein
MYDPSFSSIKSFYSELPYAHLGRVRERGGLKIDLRNWEQWQEDQS